MTTSTATRKAFKVLGTTDEVTECEHCGRVDLRGTIVLGVLDENGAVDGEVYFGSTCGAKATGWTAKKIRDDADKANQEASRQAWRDANGPFIAWVRATYDVNIRSMADLGSGFARRQTGKRPTEVRAEFDALAA